MKESTTHSIKFLTTESNSKAKSIISTPGSVQKENLSTLLVDLRPNTEDDMNKTISDTDSENDENREDLSIEPQNSGISSLPPNYDRPKLNLPSKNDFRHEHGRWTQKEHQLFLEGLMLYGNEWKNVQNHIGTRSATQARSHAQKFFIKLRKGLSDETDSKKLKSRICSIFESILGPRFRPDNIDCFIAMMKKLIFTSESVTPSTKIWISHDEDTRSYKDLQRKATNPNETYKNIFHSPNYRNIIIEKDDDLDSKSSVQNNSYYSSDSSPSAKPQIFNISKDCSRKPSYNFPPKEQSKNEHNKQFSSFPKSFQQTSPSCINFVTINMVNNSQNNYVNQSCQTLDTNIKIPTQFTNNTYHPKIEHKPSNPFNIQFEGLLGLNTKSNNLFCNNNCGFNFMEDPYNNSGNNDITSLLNIWN